MPATAKRMVGERLLPPGVNKNLTSHTLKHATIYSMGNPLMSDEPSSPTKPSSVRCRPYQWPWIFVLILGAFTLAGFLIPKAPNTQAWEHLVMLGLFGCTFGLPTILGALWLSRTTIVADENGLRWRSIGGWRQAQWQQVQDYYGLYSPKPEFTLWRIETEAGKIALQEGHFSHTAALREAVQQHAQWAKPREWQIKGMRQAIDWPHTFSYRSQGDREFFIGHLILSVFWVGFGVRELVTKSSAFYEVWSYSGLVMAIIGLLIWLALILFVPLLTGFWLLTYREFQARRHERITVSATGLIFENNRERIAIPWDEVQDYYSTLTKGSPAQHRYVVIGKNGSFDFAKIEEVGLLKKLISQLACNTPFHEWREYRPTSTSPVKRYDYRNRNVRSLLMGSGVLFITLLLVRYYVQTTQTYDSETRAESLIGWIFIGILGGCFLWMWRHYKVSSMTISDEGITQRGWCTKNFLAWEDIQELRTSSSSPNTCYIVGHQKLSFSPFITDYYVLKTEIERRAVNAQIHPSWKGNTTQ